MTETEPGHTAVAERRRNRLSIRSCSKCGERHVSTRVTLRTSHVVYVRCGACGDVWAQAKPDTPDTAP